MIGWSGILVQFAMVGVAIFFGTVSLAQLRQSATWRNILLVLVFVPLALMLLWKQIAHALYLETLHSLRSEMVAQIVVDGMVFNTEAEKSALSNALNRSVWFEPKHGGWRKPSSLTVVLKSGKTVQYSVALYPSGAVVLGRSEAFSTTLPGVLSDLGHPLSTDLNR